MSQQPGVDAGAVKLVPAGQTARRGGRSRPGLAADGASGRALGRVLLPSGRVVVAAAALGEGRPCSLDGRGVSGAGGHVGRRRWMRPWAMRALCSGLVRHGIRDLLSWLGFWTEGGDDAGSLFSWTARLCVRGQGSRYTCVYLHVCISIFAVRQSGSRIKTRWSCAWSHPRASALSPPSTQGTDRHGSFTHKILAYAVCRTSGY